MAESAGEVLERLKRQEAKEVGGAPTRMPKQMMLDASDVAAKHPDKHLRWVSLKDDNKLASRKMEGYVALNEKEGGKTLGNELVLMGLPKQLYEQRVARQNAENERRLSQHTKEWENLAESAARELRDRHGIRVDSRDLLRT